MGRVSFGLMLKNGKPLPVTADTPAIFSPWLETFGSGCPACALPFIWDDLGSYLRLGGKKPANRASMLIADERPPPR